MPNLRLIKEFHRKYGKEDDPFSDIEFDNQRINEAIDPRRIEKALTDKVADLGPRYVMYFEVGKPADLALLFVDICSFSEKYEDLNDDDLVDFLDRYYDSVLPIIQSYGGEVDKIMGDGIICLFGPPFLDDNLTKNIGLAYECSKEIIKLTNSTEFESKIALHAGQIRYYKNSSIYYHEYTIIGKMMTEIFRLESISENGKINFYSGSEVDFFMTRKLINSRKSRILPESILSPWKVSTDKMIRPRLRGVEFEHYRTVRLNI